MSSFHARWLTAALVTALLAGVARPSQAGLITGVTYTYDAATVANVGIRDDNGTESYTNRFALTDGVIIPTQTSAANPIWNFPGAVLYSLNGTAFPQPGLTLTLPQAGDLGKLRVHYYVRQTSGVQAPSSAVVTVGSTTLPAFTGFDNSRTFNSENGGGDARVAEVNLTGLSGNTIHIDFRNGNGTEGGIGAFTGLSEIQVFSPEPPVPLLTAYSWRVLKDNARFYWNFNEPGPTDNAADRVRGQANDRLVSQGGAFRDSSATPNLGYAATTNGSNFFQAAALGDGSMAGAWAIEMWVKADGALAGSRGDYLMNAGGNNPAFIHDFGVGGDNKIEMYAVSGRTAGGGPSINDNEWHHLVATFYGNGAGFGVADRIDFAIDGVVIPNVPRGNFSSGFDLNTQLLIGAALTNGANGFQGQIDEVAFYDLSGLSVAQVAARTQQIAGHYALASQPANTNLRYIPGVTYQIDPATPAQTYGAPFNVRLTDGEIGSSGPAPWDQQNWVGWLNVNPKITFDLRGTPVLDSIFIDYLGGTYTPDTVLVEFSMDGVDYGLVPSIVSSDFNDFGTGGQARRLVLEANDVMARFVRMTFTRDDPWIFLGEMTFVEQVPEPGTLTLLALGGLGLAWWRRRK